MFNQQCCIRQHPWHTEAHPPKVCQQLLKHYCCCLPALLQLRLCRAADIGQSSQLLLQDCKQMSADEAAAQCEQINLNSNLGKPLGLNSNRRPLPIMKATSQPDQ